MISFEDAVKKYGPITDGVWTGETSWCVMVEIPSALVEGWINSATGHATHHIYCNKDMADPLHKALQNVIDRSLLSELKTFDGCYEIRDIRGIPGKFSTHAYALAIDLNAATNKLGTSGDIHPGLVQCFKDSGFLWGGDFHRCDPMHFQVASW